jgi:hypothetical protein
MVKLKATNLKTGEERIFTLDDLYGYEGFHGEGVEGIFLKGKKGEETWQISYNCGYRMGGMNPDLKIEITSSQNKGFNELLLEIAKEIDLKKKLYLLLGVFEQKQKDNENDIFTVEDIVKILNIISC